MDEKLAKTLAAPDFEAWRRAMWKEISTIAIGNRWVPESEMAVDGVINHHHDRWSGLWDTLVEIRYLFRPPVSRCVHARFRQNPKGEGRVGVKYLSFHTSPLPAPDERQLFEKRRSELLEWRASGGIPPKATGKCAQPKRSPKCR